jgi:hypothetical protein
MIAGAGNFPSGRFRCETSFLNPNIADENGESSRHCAKNAKKANKKGGNIFHEGVTGLRTRGENAKSEAAGASLTGSTLARLHPVAPVYLAFHIYG